jgi:hypothetical protein
MPHNPSLAQNHAYDLARTPDDPVKLFRVAGEED